MKAAPFISICVFHSQKVDLLLIRQSEISTKIYPHKVHFKLLETIHPKRKKCLSK